MGIQNIMWTALPNGLTDNGQTGCALSVLVSPRLVTDQRRGGNARAVPEFPGLARGGGGPAVPGAVPGRACVQRSASGRASLPGARFGGMECTVSQRYFRPLLSVRRPCRTRRALVSNQAGAGLRAESVQVFRGNSSGEKPNVEMLGFDPRRAGGGQLGQVVLSPQLVRQLDDRLDTLLKEYGAVPPEVSFPALIFTRCK